MTGLGGVKMDVMEGGHPKTGIGSIDDDDGPWADGSRVGVSVWMPRQPGLP